MAWIDRGPPPRITQDKIDLILEAIGKNLPYAIAADFAKVHERTLFRWMKKGWDDLEDGLITDYSQLCQSIKEIEAQKISSHLGSVENQTERWQARAWILERRWREHFTGEAAEIEFRKRLDELKQSKLGSDNNGSKD